MSEVVQPGVLETPKQRRTFKVSDVVLAVIVLAVIIILAVTLLSKLRLQHEVNSAQVVSSRVIRDISSRNASDARSLGDSAFQVKHSVAQLQSLFASASNLVTVNPNVDRKIVSNTASGQTVYFIYRYPGKQYYIRIATTKTTGSDVWHLTGISGNNSEQSLIVK